MKTIFITLIIYLMVSLHLFAQEPEWLWATKAGGNTSDGGKAITLDSEGNCYITGYFRETAIFGSYSLINSGEPDIFVAKIDEDGNWLWASKARGTDVAMSNAITNDNNGNIYVTGYFEDTAIFGSYSITSNGEWDIFIAKIDEDGNWLWASQAGGTGNDVTKAITLDNEGNSYVTGSFANIATFGSYSITSSGAGDIFIAKIDEDGNWLSASQAGGNGGDTGMAIILDDEGNNYVTGIFSETVTFGSYSLTSSNEYFDIFVAKIDEDGNWLWASQAGGNNHDYANAIQLDEMDNCYITGYFRETATFGDYTLPDTNSDTADIFVAKLDEDGNWLWATQAEGSHYYNRAYGMAIDEMGNNYVSGVINSTTIFGSYTLLSSGEPDIFIAKIDEDGNWLWASQSGGNNWDWGFCIAVDAAGNSYVTGYFKNIVTFGSYSLTSNGENDIFVAKNGVIPDIPVAISATTNGTLTFYANWNTSSEASGYYLDVATDENFNTYLSGYENLDVGDVTTYSVTATSAINHYYRVRAYNDNGTSSNSNIIEVFGSTLPVELLSFTSVYNTSESGNKFVSIDWSTASEVDINGFNVHRSMENTFSTSDKINDELIPGTNTTQTHEYSYYDEGVLLQNIQAGDEFWYWLEVVELNGISIIHNESAYLIIPDEYEPELPPELPIIYGLYQNVPNPFNPTNMNTKICFNLQENSNVRIDIYNVKGQLVRNLYKGYAEFGEPGNPKVVIWDGRNEHGIIQESGIYFYKMSVDGVDKEVKKLLLIL